MAAVGRIDLWGTANCIQKTYVQWEKSSPISDQSISSLYPIPIPFLHHDTSAITTDCNCSPTYAVSSAWPSQILTWHRNETRSSAIADLIWYSAGLPDVVVVGAEKFSAIYITFTNVTVKQCLLWSNHKTLQFHGNAQTLQQTAKNPVYQV